MTRRMTLIACCLLIEGTIDKTTISGTFKAGDRSGQFTFTKL